MNLKVAVLLGVVASVTITRIASAQLIGKVCAFGKYSPCEAGFVNANVTTATYKSTCYNETAALTPHTADDSMVRLRCYSPTIG
eukprot:CAMPEP_0198211796 /NCGR_PEP_ID=MMETSP1445-20131203/25348_1 /TAXON_ID=36898 /ORGANISM="Pyramimonas sp., Strain CCMP2087" /LENGTH=83 /DNA_ID=CAMNT_0043886133 /DNA_START=203 /DNA_END=451 /DNA_ORIENTATION=+